LTESDIARLFPALNRIDDDIGREVLANARLIKLPPDTMAFELGSPCENYLLVMSGTVRVQQTAENGREIVLYRVHPGESCVLTTSCLIARNRYPAEGITETEVEAIMIPAPIFQQALEQSDGFRKFVLEGYGQRLTDLMAVIENIAFRRMDCRLAEKLLAMSSKDAEIAITHQALAMELGSAREVISRQLKEFERKEWIQLGRGTIRIVDTSPLRSLAECD
jgi:CRP/FNR family transcriptional regulator